MTTIRLESPMFESHPSLSASLQDFEDEVSPTMIKIPSTHSGFRDDNSAPESSTGPWSPTGFPPTLSSGSNWYRRQPYRQETRSATRSIPPFDDDDPTLPMNIPLPRGSTSPAKDCFSPSPSPEVIREAHMGTKSPEPEEKRENYIRFSVRADVQHRTDTIENTIRWVKGTIYSGRKSTFLRVLSVLFASVLLLRFATKAQQRTFPDIVQLAGLSKSFEPLIYFSENGISQIGELDETGVAVWDLGESVRIANMTSASIIVNELDGLSETLKTLARELTLFFTAVNGDVDSILLTMDWARRELSQLPRSTVLDSMYGLFAMVGMLADPHNLQSQPGALDRVMYSLLGRTPAQHSRLTLDRAFTELLSALEESINSELTHTAKLFALFSTIDQQFLNLQRATVRELDTQEQLESELLERLWVRLGSSRLKKFEKNKKLLQNLRERTVNNKNVLTEHNTRLMTLKGSLDNLRRRLVNPLIRGESISIDAQIEGLEKTHEYLKIIREQQKTRVYESLYGRTTVRQQIDGRL